MTKSEFLKIKMSAKTPQFNELAGISRDENNTSFLIEFCTLLHPNQDKCSSGCMCNVFTSKAHYLYILYKTCIIKTVVETSKKTLYKIS